MRYLYIIILSFALLFEAKAQDMQLTQFYAAPMFLNPAFTGLNTCSRLSSNYRQQWAGISNGYVSSVLAYDHYVQKYNSGVGLMLTNDKAGTGSLRNFTINALYAYELVLNRKWIARFGAQGTRTKHDINMSKLILGDQIARGDASTSVDVVNFQPVTYYDFSSGALFYSQKYWFGFSAHHINQPNVSLLGGQSKLPAKYSIHGGAKFIVDYTTITDKQNHMLTPCFTYRFQEKFDQVDIGTYYNFHPIVIGVWYRGLPGLKAYKKGYQNNDAVAVLVGIQAERFNVGYSYDYTISRLINRTSGSHEVSLSYMFCSPKRKNVRRPKILVPCPRF